MSKYNLAAQKVPDEMKEWLEREAQRTGRSVNGLIRAIIQAAMEKSDG